MPGKEDHCRIGFGILAGIAAIVDRGRDRVKDAVNAWLAANRPASRLGDSVLPHCLEFEVAALITRATETKRLRAQCRTKLVTIEDGQVFTYALKGRALDDVRARVLAARPTARIVNGDETALAVAIDTLIAVDDRDSA